MRIAEAPPPKAAPAPASPEPAPQAAPQPEVSAQATETNPFDLEKVLSDSSLWPKTVVLKKAVEFPAVSNGKVIGKVKAPAGAEARIVTLKNGKVGVEYHGGGAWLELGNTDFVERAKLAWH